MGKKAGIKDDHVVSPCVLVPLCRRLAQISLAVNKFYQPTQCRRSQFVQRTDVAATS